MGNISKIVKKSRVIDKYLNIISNKHDIFQLF